MSSTTSCCPPKEFFTRAARVMGRQPTKEERDESEVANARMAMNLEGSELRESLVRLSGGDVKKADRLLNQFGQGALWILYHGTYGRCFSGNRPDYQRELKEGIAEDAHTAWHENGKVKEQGRFIANARVGEWRTFDSSGAP